MVNRSIVKWIAALAVPAGFSWWFYYAQQQAAHDVEEYKRQQKEHPTNQQISIDNYELKEVDDNDQVHWQLTAKRGVMATKGQIVTLEDINVSYYDGPVLKMHLAAPIGEANEQTKFVKLSEDKRRKVTCDGEAGKLHMETRVMELTKNNQFVARGGVNIILPKVARVYGDEASGNINITALKDFKVSGNTRASVDIN